MVRAVTPYTIADPPPRDQWEAFVTGHPKGSVFHTPQMHEVHARTRRNAPLALAALGRDGQIAALLTAVRVDTLLPALGPLSSRSVLFAEPLCRPSADDALATLVREHDARMGRRVVFTEVRPLGPPCEERAVLEEAGYAYEPYLNFLVDLRRPPEELLGAMTSSARSRIRRGERTGVVVQEVAGAAGVALVYPFLQEAYRRSRVPLADRSLFEAAARVLEPSGAARTFVAFHDGVPVGGKVLLLHGEVVFFWYGATGRGTPGVGEVLDWHCMRWALEHGFGVYDQGGAGRPDEPYGVRDFKRKFGGEEVCYGRYRRVYSPRRLALAEGAYDLVRTRAAPVARLVFGAGRGSRDAAEDERPGRASG